MTPEPAPRSEPLMPPTLPIWPCADYLRTATIELTSRPRRELLGAALRSLGCPIGIPEEDFVNRIVDRLSTRSREPLLRSDEIRPEGDGDIEVSFQDQITVRGGMAATQLQIVIDLHGPPGLRMAERDGGTRCSILLRDGVPTAVFDFEHRCSSGQRERFGALLRAYLVACNAQLPDLRHGERNLRTTLAEGVHASTY